jgi:hypothetical protein
MTSSSEASILSFLKKPCKKHTTKGLWICKQKGTVPASELPKEIQKEHPNGVYVDFRYIGETKKIDGVRTPDGHGRMIWFERFDDGDFYEGEFKAGKAHGYGKMVWKDSTKFNIKSIEGDFSYNNPEGFAKIIYKDGDIYEGEIISPGVPNGKGKIYYKKTGNTYIGTFVNGKRVGTGQKITKEGKKIDVIKRTKLSKEAFKCFKEREFKCSFPKFKKDTEQSENKYSQFDSKYWLAIHYTHGLGRERDTVKGIKLHEEVFNSGFDDLKKNSLVYLTGSTFVSIPRLIDGKRAIKYNEENIRLILKMSEDGKEANKSSLKSSYYNAAFIYQNGIDVKKDLKKSFEYYGKSHGPNSYNAIGLFYTLGLGPVDVSKDDAIKYYKKTIDWFENVYSDESWEKSKKLALEKIEKIDKERGWLGAKLEDLGETYSKAIGYPKKYGVFVREALIGGPAAKAGIQFGDVINKLNGQYMSSVPLFMETLKKMKPGDKIKITVWRKGEFYEKEVSLTEYSPSKALSRYDYTVNVDYVVAKSLINLLETFGRVPADYLELTDWIKSDMKNYPELIVFLVDIYRNYDHMQSYVWSKIALDSYAELNLDKKNEKINKEGLYKYIIVLEAIFLDKNEVDKALKIAARKKDVLLAEIEGTGKVIFSLKEPVISDTEGPIIEVKSEIVSKSSEYSIEGKVTDKSSEVMTLHVNGEPISIDQLGKFIITRFNPSGETLEIKAWDEWANSTVVSVKVIVEEEAIADIKDVFEPLKLPTRRIKQDNNKVAIVIGIENYENAPKAAFANRDAEFFTEYLKRVFGVPRQNLITLRDEEAKLIPLFTTLEKWLPGVAGDGGRDIYVFYAGHGLSSDDGKELYLLAHNSDPDLLKRTAILRSDLFSLIDEQKPKSVTIFFDTCYSGPSRDGEMLIDDSRPIRIAADDDNNIPSNFNIFSAAKSDQISSSIPEIKHGIFSYYLMKGLEGKSDVNNDHKITNQELIDYLNSNTRRVAAKVGRKQNPVLTGDPDQVLMKY